MDSKHKNIIRLLIYIILIVLFATSIQKHKQTIINTKTAEITSFDMKWKINGKPVIIKKIKYENFDIFEKISFKQSENSDNLFTSFVTKNIKDVINPQMQGYIIYNNQKFYGHISYVSEQIDFKNGLYKIDFKLNSEKKIQIPNNIIIIGYIKINTLSNVIKINNNSIFKTNDNKEYVWILNKDKTAKKFMIKTFYTDNEFSFIKNGLKSGDNLIIEGCSILNNGDKVEILNSGDKN